MINENWTLGTHKKLVYKQTSVQQEVNSLKYHGWTNRQMDRQTAEKLIQMDVESVNKLDISLHFSSVWK